MAKDEPTTGMDPITKQRVLNSIVNVVRDNRSVILTSHRYVIHYTVKPALVTTCIERPPVNKDHILCFPWKLFLIETCTKGTCT